MNMLRELTKARLTLAQRFTGLQAFETKGDVGGDGRQCLQDKFGQGMTCKHGDNPE
jgi:hypothetical protein